MDDYELPTKDDFMRHGFELAPREAVSTPICSICIDEFTDSVSHNAIQLVLCDHIFGSACLLEWLNTANTCPLCRTKLFKSDDQPVLSVEASEESYGPFSDSGWESDDAFEDSDWEEEGTGELLYTPDLLDILVSGFPPPDPLHEPDVSSFSEEDDDLDSQAEVSAFSIAKVNVAMCSRLLGKILVFK